jgi:deoxyribodipyrimidine photo-lyase
MVHEPWTAGGLFDPASGTAASEYPPPIVDHALTSKQAKDRIAAIRKTDGFRHDKQAVVQRHGSRKTLPRKRRAQAASDDQLDLFR